jgi:hypothetical protein
VSTSSIQLLAALSDHFLIPLRWLTSDVDQTEVAEASALPEIMPMIIVNVARQCHGQVAGPGVSCAGIILDLSEERGCATEACRGPFATEGAMDAKPADRDVPSRSPRLADLVEVLPAAVPVELFWYPRGHGDDRSTAPSGGRFPDPRADPIVDLDLVLLDPTVERLTELSIFGREATD